MTVEEALNRAVALELDGKTLVRFNYDGTELSFSIHPGANKYTLLDDGIYQDLMDGTEFGADFIVDYYDGYPATDVRHFKVRPLFYIDTFNDSQGGCDDKF